MPDYWALNSNSVHCGSTTKFLVGICHTQGRAPFSSAVLISIMIHAVQRNLL